jgi:hypothetical protein
MHTTGLLASNLHSLVTTSSQIKITTTTPSNTSHRIRIVTFRSGTTTRLYYNRKLSLEWKDIHNVKKLFSTTCQSWRTRKEANDNYDTPNKQYILESTPYHTIPYHI